MLKNLLANKKILILGVVVIFVIVGAFITILIRNDFKKGGQSGVSIENSKEQDKDTDTDATYNGEGLEVQDTLDEPVYTIDGSGDWSGSTEKDNQIDASQSENKPSDAQLDNIPSEKTEQEDSNNKTDDTADELEGDILEDDKIWSNPS